MRLIRQALFNKFIPQLNKIHFQIKSNAMIEKQMNIQVRGPDPVPEVNPQSVSRELLHSINELNELNCTKESIKKMFTPDMVEFI